MSAAVTFPRADIYWVDLLTQTRLLPRLVSLPRALLRDFSPFDVLLCLIFI